MSSPAEPCDFSIGRASKLLADGTLSALELLTSAIDRLEKTESQIHAYVDLMTEAAMQQAAAFEWVPGGSRLQGIPVAIKDIYDVRGVATRCGSRSRQLADPAVADAVTVSSLRDAGAVFVGKSVTQEFAAGVVSAPARNSWDATRIPGGSSGGSATAVAAGSALAATGSDTGGSIRIPASVCGVVGLKPTYGLLPVDGIYPLSWSLDTAGPLARTVEDTWIMFQAMRGISGSDDVLMPKRVRADGQPIRVGIPRGYFFDRLQMGVLKAVEGSLDTITGEAIDLIEIDWPEAESARACSFIINRVETAGVHAHRIETYGHEYGEELRLRIEASALFPATGYIDALRARSVIRDRMAQTYRSHDLDVIITPATPGTAAPANHTFVDYPDGGEEHVSLAYTRLTMPFNVTGQPALSIPCGLDERGLPVGMQIAGRPYQELDLCRIGMAIEEMISFDRSALNKVA